MTDIEQIKREVQNIFTEEHRYVVGMAVSYLHSRGYLGGVPEWKPIETYDYENFPQVMLAGFITPSEHAQSNGSKPFWEISIGRCWHVNTRKFTGFLGQQPTHWQPLPVAPNTIKKPENVNISSEHVDAVKVSAPKGETK